MRLKYIYLLPVILLLMFFSAVSAQTPDQMMDEANKLYQKNDFTNPQKLYKDLIDAGYQSPVLYYNFGNTHYRMGNLGYALYYYEKALKLAPGDEDIIMNIKIANSRTVDKIIEVPKIFITRWWDSLVVSLSLSGWSFVLLLVFVLFLFYLGMYLLTKRNSMQRMAFFSGSAALVILILVSFIWYSRLNVETSSNYGILLEKSVTVKVSPDSQSNDAFVIHEGIKFSIEERINTWYKIRLADGKLGWIPDYTAGKI